jgi:hypothetical protein
MTAALSHVPFQTQRAIWYSWGCIWVTGAQAWALLAPILLKVVIRAELHMQLFGTFSGLCFIILAIYIRISN